MIYWIGKLFTDGKGHLTALYEVVINAVISLAPFFVTYFVESADRADGSFIPLSELVGRGQLYLLSYGVFASVFWLAFLKDGKHSQGARGFLGAIGMIAMLPVVGSMGVDPTFSKVLNPNLVYLSIAFYFVFLVLNYLLLFYQNIDPPTPTEVLDREAGDMASRYRSMAR